MRVATDAAELEVDAVVIAIPTAPLAEVEFDPPLEGPTADALRGDRSTARTQSSSCACANRRRRARSCPSPATSGPTPSSLASGEPAPFVVGYTGTRAAIDALGGSAGTAEWIEALAALRSDDLELDPETALLSTWHDDPWVRGAYSARSLAAPMRDDDLQRPIGPLFFAGEHTAGDWHGLMEGALRSGRRAAEQSAGTPEASAQPATSKATSSR